MQWAVRAVSVAIFACLFVSAPASAQGALSVQILNGYNVVVDSNVTSPSTYGPAAGYIGARVCNTGNASLSNVIANVGNYNGGGVSSTPGTFPVFSSTGDLVHTQLTNTGNYSLTLQSGGTSTSLDGSRYIGTVAAGQCVVEYWLFSYPQCVNVGSASDSPPCAASIAGDVKPNDDLSLNYDIWASTTTAITPAVVNQRRAFTMRNEISASANKIWPNTSSKVPDAYLAAIQSVIGWGTLGPDGQPLSGSNPVYPGQRVITTQGIWYDLGNVGQGFDNNGDLIPDQNAWLQPVGDAAAFDADCFRMVNVYGLLIVKLKTGGEQLVPFQNQLYFEHIPDNTGAVGLVYYQFVATDSGCSAVMTPYQEAASGFDNEKFSADFGLSNPLSSTSFGPALSFTKTDGLTSTTAGSTLTYAAATTNSTGANLGAPDLGVAMTIRDSIPAGTRYVSGSATSNNTPPSGTGSYTQGYTDNDGNVDTCTINYSISSSSYTALYSTNNGSTWTATDPGSSVTDILWILDTTLQLDGYHNGASCVAPNGVYDNGTLRTSLPAGKNTTVRFQVTVNTVAPFPGPVVCNTAMAGFGGATSGTTAQDCTLIQGINSITGSVFKDEGTGVGGIYGNGVKDGTEGDIGTGVSVTLYYDLNGNGVVDSTDPSWGNTTTAPVPNIVGVPSCTTNGCFRFTGLPDGPFLVVVKKYDGATSNGINDAATDTAFGTNGWGNTTADPNLALTTDTGLVKLNEDLTTATMAVNIDLDHNNGSAVHQSGPNFGFAPPLRVTKSVSGNPDSNADGRADTTIDEGDLFTYNINLENRLPSVGVQGPTGCQYTVWAPTGTNGSPASKQFTNPTAVWDGPNRNVGSVLVQNGGLRFIDSTGFVLPTQAGNITKVEALVFGYFASTLNDDNLTLGISRPATGFTSTTMNTALIDSYVGEPADLSPNSAISWDVTALRPGGGTWSWADNFSTVTVDVNPSKSSSADEKNFYLDAVGLRVTTDQNCDAGTSTTLSPVPLQDSYDPASVDFVSASPTPTSVNTATGIIQWADVGPILPGSTASVAVTMRARNITGTRTGTCGVSAPPTSTSACNWAEGGFGTSHVYYADGRLANDASSKIAIAMQGKNEVHGALWKDTNADGWAYDAGEPFLPNITVTLWGCVQSDGVTMETSAPNKTCTAATSGNFWKKIATDITDSNGAYDFIGLDTGYYLVEVGDNDNAPAVGNSSPFSGTQTAEPNDSQAPLGGGAATGTVGVCVGGCNNTWGSPTANLSALNLIGSVAEESITGVNFGYNIPSAIIYGNIWWDVDADATRDATDGNLSGFTVQIYSDPNGDGNPADGTLQATTTSDSNGEYTFSGLAAGSYVVSVTPPTLLHKVWTETVESTGGTGSLNNQIPMTVTAGQVSGSHDFGYTQVDASDIGDYLYYDFDGDGIFDSGESGIPNVTVWLYEDIDRDGTIDAGVDSIVATTASDSTGHYLFSNFPAGSYIVKVDTTDPDFPTDVLASGDPDLSAASIGDTIYYDLNASGTQTAGEDGIPLVIVNLYSDNDSSGTLNGADSLIASTVTDVNGKYLFTGLTAGRYFVDVDESSLPSTALALTTADPASTVVILSGSTSATSDLTKDAGYSPSSNFAIGNRIWHDVNNNGVQDAGEPGIPNVDIVVTNGTGTGCAGGCRVTTDEAGFWIVTGLTNGTFSVNVDDTDPDFPRDFTLTTGTDPRTVTVAGADLNNVDFGYHYTGTGSTPTGTISGRVFQDADGDLAYDAGEERTSKTVNLLDSEGNIVASTTTSGTGTYSFTGVFVGDYTVEAVDQLGTRYSTLFLNAAQTIANLNIIYQTTIEATADSQSSVAIDGVHSNLLQDFGYQRFFGSIGDTVYWDVNENGTQDVGDPGLANVTVRLYDAVWTDTNNDGYFQSGEGTKTLVATTSTASDNPLTTANEGGTYLFSNLSALASGHKYLVVVDTTTLPGVTHPIIADPDTDGVPCTSLSGATDPPSSVCDSEQLITGFNTGNNYLGADFGYRITGTNYATIGDHLWIDTDGDGVMDSGEIGIDAVTVWLDTDNDGVVDWTDGNGNNVWDAGEGERWTTTDPDGYYTFTGITDGTYNLKVLATDPDFPTGLTETFEVRSGNTASRDNAVQVVVSGGAVTSIVDGDPGTLDTCSSCNLNVDFGYRYAGTNTLSGTVCVDDATKNGYCGATATTYSGVDTANGEVALPGITVTAYRWTDSNSNNTAWSLAGVLDAGDSFVLLGSVSADASGDYTFTHLPDNVILVFSISDTAQLLLTTTNLNTSVEDANVLKRQLYEGTTTYAGNTVTVIGRQALSIGGDTDDNVKDVDYAFDATLGGALAYDFGDLPSSYVDTLLSESGAQHRVTGSSIYLGSGVSTESDGKPSVDATGDTQDNGVTMVSTTLVKGGSMFVDVTASQAGWLAAWFDWNGDGDFDDADENVIDRPVTAGVNSLNFYVPTTVPNGLTDFFARFRIYPSRPQIVASSGPGFDSNFAMMDGEDEDYIYPFSNAVTFAEISTMDAVQGKNSNSITWSTNRETDNLGFDLYRSVAGGPQEKLNPHLIIGSAFVSGRQTTGPRAYRFVDHKPLSGLVQYWVEDVDLNGTRTMHGPITPHTSATEPLDDTLNTETDPTIGSVGGKFTTADGMGVAIPEPDAPGAKQLAEQWSLASVPAVKVIVTRPGWYRVKKSDLLAAGFDPGNNPNSISVFTEGVEVPVVLNAKNGNKFDNDDSIEFFGRGIDTQGTGGRVYYITAKKGSAARVKSTGGRGNSGTPSTASFPYTFERVERTIFFTALTNNGERSNFFGPVLFPMPATQALTVTNPGSGNAELEVIVQGASANFDHVISLVLNGTNIGYVRLFSQERHIEKFPVPASLLVAGENTLVLTAENGWDDISVLESLRLTYPHAYRADNNALTFTLDGGNAATVNGFTSSAIRVVDVTDPLAPVFIDATIGNASDGTKSVSFATTGSGTRTIFAFAESRVLAPAAIAWNEPSTWNASTNAANLLIITNKAFLSAANALKTARQAQGISTQVVDVQNVYDEFSYGHHSAQAVRDFLKRTTTWKTPPHYVILLGDASFDPRNYMGLGSYDFVPTKLINTTVMKASSDDWFADFDDSGLPSIAMGRIPARTAAEATGIVNKLVSRNVTSGDAWGKIVEVIADIPEGHPFDTEANKLSAVIPSPFTVDRISIATTPSPGTAIVNAFNRGSVLTEFIGHGSMEIWSHSLFTSTTAASLTNAPRLPFVVAMNCFNGYFHDLFTNSLGEALLRNPSGGAIGVWASSGLITTPPQVAMGLEFNRRVFGTTPTTIGDAVLAAKRATNDRDVRRTFILFGDPTLKLK
ncbi:MAG: hypothetical protein DMF56_22060 [Acidobacteria bacterium]|nr:MAG: hypothetical protein DMF56_22060 [Acidobacteriota bacterium]